jgi:hypothetical protein
MGLMPRHISAAQQNMCKIVCYLGYLAYLVFGAGLVAIAVTYTVEIEGAHVYITVALFFAGAVMVGLGGVALVRFDTCLYSLREKGAVLMLLKTTLHLCSI